MRRVPPGSLHRRAVVAVAALYALLLQSILASILASMLPAMPLDPQGAAICAGLAGAASPVDDGLACRQHECCLAPRLAQPLAGLRPTAGVALPPPPDRIVASAWTSPPRSTPRAPPDPTGRPRGPPAAA